MRLHLPTPGAVRERARNAFSGDFFGPRKGHALQLEMKFDERPSAGPRIPSELLFESVSASLVHSEHERPRVFPTEALSKLRAAQHYQSLVGARLVRIRIRRTHRRHYTESGLLLAVDSAIEV